MKLGLFYTISVLMWVFSFVACAIAFVYKAYWLYPIFIVIGLVGVIYCAYKDTQIRKHKCK